MGVRLVSLTISGRSALLASAAALGMTTATAAHSQSAGPQNAPPSPTAPAAPNAAPAPSSQVGEVVVTAQRRAERLQDIPLSVEAVSGAAIRNADISELDRIEQIAPGVRVGRSGADPRPAIRGTYTEAIQGSSDPRIGFYIDEIYQSRTTQAGVPLFDLERVEVQKGPQGTLYGRNSFGGNIAVTTATPKDITEGGLDLLYGNYNRIKVEGYFNAPIAPGLDFRIAGMGERRDGFIQSEVTSKADVDDQGQYYVRGSLKWVPPSLGGKLEVLLHASYWNVRDRGDATFNQKTIGLLDNPALITKPGGTLNYGNGTFTFPNGFGGETYNGILFPLIAGYRDGIPDINGADVGIPIPGKYKSLADYHAFQREQEQSYTANVGYDLNKYVRLRSITGFVNFDAVRTGDSDATPAPFAFGYDLTRDRALSQEFQVQSREKASPLQYTVGAYYLYDRVGDGFLSTYEGNHGYSTASAIASGQYVIYRNSPFNFSPLLATSSNILAGSNDAWSPLTFGETQSYATYAQSSYTFFDKLTFTGGVRYTIDHKTLKTAINDINPAGTPTNYETFAPTLDFNQHCDQTTASSSLNGGTVRPNSLITRCNTHTFEFTTYRAAVDYKFDRDHLVYASFSTGKHSGGFGTSPIPNGTVSGVLAPFNTENVQAYEIGSKNQFFDHRLQVNLAAFFNNYTHLQIQGNYANPLNPNSVISYITNGGSDHTPGVDLEFLAKPIRNLTLNLAVNYLHARDNNVPLQIFSSGLCSVVAAGGTCTTAPQVGGGTGSSTFPNPISNPELFVPVLNAAGQQVFVNGVPQFNSIGYGHKNRVQLTPDISLQFGASYDIDLGEHGRLTPEFQTHYSGDYLLSASVPNFDQKAYFKTDIRITYVLPGERISVQGFVENLENVAVIERATTSSSALSGTYSDPRTFGVKVGYRF